MPQEIEPSPRTITTRLRGWWNEFVSGTEKIAAGMLSFTVGSVATQQMVETQNKSMQALNDGLSTSVKLHRQAKQLISEDDQDEMDLFELYSQAALTQTRLMTEAIAQGISPQPIDKAALARPILPSETSPTGSQSDGPREPTEDEQPAQEQGATPAKRKRGRPRKLA